MLNDIEKEFILNVIKYIPKSKMKFIGVFKSATGQNLLRVVYRETKDNDETFFVPVSKSFGKKLGYKVYKLKELDL